MELRGDGIVLRPWRPDDAPAVEAACSDPESSRWLPLLPVPYTRGDAEAYIRTCLEAGEERRPFAIADAATDELLGAIDMNVNRWRTGHVGYWVVPQARGRGVCTRALRLLSEWALTELGLGRVELMTDPGNVASQRVAEKAGFLREAVLRSVLEYRDGTRADAIMFSLLPGELDPAH
jgi:RimJ/RimL family protein N-acetyltransferase